MPIPDEETGLPYIVDEDRAAITWEELAEYEEEKARRFPVFYPFTPWENVLVGGEVRLRGVEELLIPQAATVTVQRGRGVPCLGRRIGALPVSRVVERAKQATPQVNAKEAWGWLPPPLMDEGEKVQTEWLHGFLMDPSSLRPAVVMRMPNSRCRRRRGQACELLRRDE